MEKSRSPKFGRFGVLNASMSGRYPSVAASLNIVLVAVAGISSLSIVLAEEVPDSAKTEIRSSRAPPREGARGEPRSPVAVTGNTVTNGVNMRVAVSSIGHTLDYAVDPRFGRAPTFLFVDTETGEHQTINYTMNFQAVQGAGSQAAATVSHQRAGYVITGHSGPKAFRALKAAGIKVIMGAEGTVTEAVEKLKAGEMHPSESPDVRGHWA